MKKINLMRKIVVSSMTCLAILATSVSAANYKFDFNLTTKIFYGAAYSSYATKYTKTETPVLCVTSNASGATIQYTVVNSDKDARTGTLKKNGTGHWKFTDDSTCKGYKYRLRVKTDTGNLWNTYTVKGRWNIDTY